jgi:hypothetical protein
MEDGARVEQRNVGRLKSEEPPASLNADVPRSVHRPRGVRESLW